MKAEKEERERLLIAEMHQQLMRSENDWKQEMNNAVIQERQHFQEVLKNERSEHDKERAVMVVENKIKSFNKIRSNTRMTMLLCRVWWTHFSKKSNKCGLMYC